MAIDASKLVARVKTELRIDGDYDDARIQLLIAEAAFSLQKFKCLTLVDADATVDPDTETALTPLDVRYISVYVALQYDNSEKMNSALGTVLEQVRDK